MTETPPEILPDGQEGRDGGERLPRFQMGAALLSARESLFSDRLKSAAEAESGALPQKKEKEEQEEGDNEDEESPSRRIPRHLIDFDTLTDAQKRAVLDTNDKGLADRLAAYFAGEMVWNSLTEWSVWDGRRFVSEDGGAFARRKCNALIDKMKFEEYPAIYEAGLTFEESLLMEVKQADGLKAFLKRVGRLWGAAIGVGNSNKQKAVLDMAAQMPEFLVPFNELDAHPELLNTPDGVLSLPLTPPKFEAGDDAETAAFSALSALRARASVPSDLITRETCARFKGWKKGRAKELAPVWHAHLERTQPDPESRAAMMRILGSLLVTHNPGEYWFIFRGPGGEGKSVTMRAIQQVLGDYALTGDVKSFLYDSRASASGPREDLVRLAGGNRLVVLPEPEQGDQLSGTTLKLVTGGDELSTRKGYKGQIEFRALFKIIMMCNPRPRVKSDDEGFWRRVIEVPFLYPIPEKDRDTQIDEKLAAEKDGILLSLLEGYFDWWSRGFKYDMSQTSIDATNSYRREASPMTAWIQDRVRFGGWYDVRQMEADGVKETQQFERGDYSYGSFEHAVRAAQDYFRPPEPNTTDAPAYTPTEIYEDFHAWCEAEAIDVWKMNSFTKQWAVLARDRGCTQERRNAEGRVWLGFDFVDGVNHVPGDGDESDDLALRGGFSSA